MAILSRLILLGFIFCISFTFSLPVKAQEANKYGQWQSPDNSLKNIIDDLDQIIQEGTKSRAAHPEFLQDINRILDRYRISDQQIFFSDDFADSNFSENPIWTVKKGAFTIDSFGSLYSSVVIDKPVAEKEADQESDGDRNLRILLGVLNELTREENGEQVQSDVSQAIISSTTTLPNSFTLEYSFKSKANWGSTSIGMVLGDDPQSGYHLVYQALPEENRPIQLIKYRYGNPNIIAEASGNSPNLDDGTAHAIQFIRSPNGDMVVTVDNIEILSASDFSYRGNFTGVMIINNGGNYSYDNIKFFDKQ